MKKAVLVFAALAAMAGCSKVAEPTLTVSTNAILVSAAGGTSSFEISSNTNWMISTDSQSWYTVSVSSGSGNATVIVEVDPYTESKARSGEITVFGPNVREVIGIAQTSPVAPAKVSNEYVVPAAGGTVFIPVPAGYDYDYNWDETWIWITKTKEGLELNVDEFRTDEDEYRTAVIRANFGSNILVEATIKQSWRNVEPGELLIEEIYFTGTAIEGGFASEDEYFKLTNNSDHTIYADRTVLVFNYIQGDKSEVGAYYEYPELEDALAVTTMYAIPGSGKDHPVEPGKSLIIAIHAQDFSAENPGAIDLSHADFEFYDENENYPDTDNPDVENMDIWFKQSRTITLLNRHGLASYAIVSVPKNEDAASIMENRHWSGTYYFHFDEWNFDFEIADDDAWLIPGDWVLDAVNGSIQDSFYRNPWGAAFDAGWTHAAEYFGDMERFGKSVRRKVQDGKLVDSNNSTNDFIHGTTPSLKK